MSEVGKRIAAARAYAGITSQAKLGEKIGGVSQSTMQRLEAGDRGLKPYEQRTLLAAIAEACDLPAAWFTADFSRLHEIPASDGQLRRTRSSDDEDRPGIGESDRAS